MTRRTAGTPPIAFEVKGPEDGEAVMLLNGLGMQLTQWPAKLLSAFHDAGLRTICVDNRDVGLSGRIDGAKVPNPYLQIIGGLIGIRPKAPYLVEDMADDAAAVLDELKIAQAHVLGRSMGGIISQVFGARHADRTKSLTLFMTTTGNPRLPRPKGMAAEILFNRGPEPATREAKIADIVAKWQFFQTQNGGMTEEALTAFHAAALDRGVERAGWHRQLAAILGTGDLRRFDKEINAPTLIVHGADDPLVPLAGGKDVHANIAGSRLEVIDEMGHDLPPRFIDHLSELAIRHIQQAERSPSLGNLR